MFDAIVVIWTLGFVVAIAITFMYFSCGAAGIFFVFNLINVALSFFWPSRPRAVVFIALSLLPLIVGLIGTGIGTVCINLASFVVTNTSDAVELKNIISSMNAVAWLSAGIGMLVSVVNMLVASLSLLISHIFGKNRHP